MAEENQKFMNFYKFNILQKIKVKHKIFKSDNVYFYFKENYIFNILISRVEEIERIKNFWLFQGSKILKKFNIHII